MSAPDPKAWEATDQEILRLAGCTMYMPAAIELSGIVARRRAIAELKALADYICPNCACGCPYLTLVDEDGAFTAHREDSGYTTRCEAYIIQDRIAAIEAEE